MPFTQARLTLKAAKGLPLILRKRVWDAPLPASRTPAIADGKGAMSRASRVSRRASHSPDTAMATRDDADLVRGTLVLGPVVPEEEREVRSARFAVARV
jgi:hypothetical protein